MFCCNSWVNTSCYFSKIEKLEFQYNTRTELEMSKGKSACPLSLSFKACILPDHFIHCNRKRKHSLLSQKYASAAGSEEVNNFPQKTSIIDPIKLILLP